MMMINDNIDKEKNKNKNGNKNLPIPCSKIPQLYPISSSPRIIIIIIIIIIPMLYVKSHDVKNWLVKMRES